MLNLLNLYEYHIYIIIIIYIRDLEEKLAFSESKNMALQKRVDELEEILGINEKSSSELEVQTAEDEDNICKGIPTEKTSKVYDQDTSKNSILNCTTKQKNEKV